MADCINRFRPTAALLDGYHELENREIYFAPSTQFKGRLKGYKDMSWHGILRSLERGRDYRVTDASCLSV